MCSKDTPALGARCMRLAVVVFAQVAGGVCCLAGATAAMARGRWMDALAVQEVAWRFGGGVPSSKWASVWSAFGQLSGNLAKSLTDLQLDVDE